MITDTLEEAIQLAIWGEISGKLHTAIPAKVNSYDSSQPSVEAQPVVKKVYYDGTELTFPMIVSVPVIFPRTNNFHLSFPIEKGDMVLLLFAERSIAEFLQTGNESIPQNTRKFSLTDAVAIPGLFGFKRGSKIENSSNMEIIFKNTKIISDGDNVDISASKVRMGTTTPLSGIVTGESICAFTGTPHPDKSSKMFAEK